MDIKFIKPKHPILQEVMEGCYIADFNTPIEYKIFPSNLVVITSITEFDYIANFSEHSVTLLPTKNQHNISTNIICSYSKPIKFNSKDTYKEVNFVFKSLGFNTLIKEPLFNLKIGVGNYTPFNLFEDYHKMIAVILEATDEATILKEIENYWLPKYIGFKNEKLKNIIKELKQNPTIEINFLSEKYNLSRQYLNKLFKLHLCKSPSQFKKVQRFRNALKNYSKSKETNQSLTDLTYESLYYDQSHLIKDFDSFSKMSPSLFFKNNKDIQDGLLNWNIK